ncbi:hypothetical protein [Arthrobacter sp. 35W]|uniref:hypothetical protein n=1 Tax=Arthrobacter sp. 35W TaxID=1132441 RepID=UPI0003F7059C|nr:hypothetical protein [Arthrobacter sp. 35W]
MAVSTWAAAAPEPAPAKYTSGATAFRYPSGMQVMADGGMVHIVNGHPVADHAVIQIPPTQGTKSPVVVLYESIAPPPDGWPQEETIQAIIDETLAWQTAATPAQLLREHRQTAIGCIAGFTFTDPPMRIEGAGLQGLVHSYTCLSRQGPIVGTFLTAITPDGMAHRLSVEASESYWHSHAAELDAIAHSLAYSAP